MLPNSQGLMRYGIGVGYLLLIISVMVVAGGCSKKTTFGESLGRGRPS
jgi:hypothetical protein